MQRKKYYAYALLRKHVQGITDNWKECEAIVFGEPEARFKSFTTRDDAQAWLGKGARYDMRTEVEPGVYFDAGTGRGQGVEIHVTNEKGETRLAKVMQKEAISPFGTHFISMRVSNNYGELLACKYALCIAMQEKIKKVFGDSKLVVHYWSKGHIKQKGISQETLLLAHEVARLRKEFEASGGSVEYVSGDDNPADLGFHRR